MNAKAAARQETATRFVRRRNLWLRAVRKLSRDRGGLLGFVFALFFILLALTAPFIAPYDPTSTNLSEAFLPFGTPGHVLGTDLYGRDVLSRVIWGARPSLGIGFVAAFLGVGFGGTLGIVIGYYGGWFDLAMMRLIDIMLAFPYLLLAIVIVGALGPGLFNAVLAVTLTAIPFYTRFIRGVVVSLRERQYVEASHALGATDSRIMKAAILPNVAPYLIVAFSINVGYLILAAASLGFLGLGTQPPSPEWGKMLAENRSYLAFAPQTVVAPGVAIFLVIIGMSLVGDALRDAFDVRLSKEAV